MPGGKGIGDIQLLINSIRIRYISDYLIFTTTYFYETFNHVP